MFSLRNKKTTDQDSDDEGSEEKEQLKSPGGFMNKFKAKIQAVKEAKSKESAGGEADAAAPSSLTKEDGKKKKKKKLGGVGRKSSRHPDLKRWNCREFKFDGDAQYMKCGKQETWQGSIVESVEKFKKDPDKYYAVIYQEDMHKWAEEYQQSCNVVHREDTINWKPKKCHAEGKFLCIVQDYERCKPFTNNVFPERHRDKYTDDFTYRRRKIHSDDLKPVMPGRGMGVGDAPNLKVIGDTNPSGILQGSVGDSWLLSGISALAEFDGAIKKLFRKTKKILKMPTDGPNVYIITLGDLETWEEVDIVIDERLCAQPRDPQEALLGAKVSKNGELWAPYIEKAVAAHAGGWDKIVGGQCTHAWALLTGCKEQYTIVKSGKNDKYICTGRFNNEENEWAEHGNSPHDGQLGMWPMAWPEVGGGGDGNLSQDELFIKMVAWDKANYIVAASTIGDSDSHGYSSNIATTGGIADKHACTVTASIPDVAGSGIDMLKVRNPLAKDKIENGLFGGNGSGWDEYPQIKELLEPVVADDGIFWMTKEEFFGFFQTIYVSALDMRSF